MNINGWEYPYDSLLHWDRRKRIFNYYGYDCLYENESLNMAILLHSIVEESMCYSAGFLAIFKNKKYPELVLQTKYSFYEKDIIFSADGRYAFAIPGKYTKGIFVFDLLMDSFAFFAVVTDTINLCVKEIKRNKFVISLSEWDMRNSKKNKALNDTEIEIGRLTWQPFNQIDAFCENLIERL